MLKNALTIAKAAQVQACSRRPVVGFRRARDAFQSFLAACEIGAGDTVLLPAFVGWSARESSGVFDPVESIGAKPIFYRLNQNLLIDVEDVQYKIREHAPKIFVLIHYFGYPDPNASALAGFARNHGVIVVEDEAHAMLSDLIGGVCGRAGDASIFSLHKMLPFCEGGALLLNSSVRSSVRTQLEKNAPHSMPLPFWEYDLHSISAIRRQNGEQLIAALAPLAGRVNLLFPTLPMGVVPQTLPVVIQHKNRDELYFSMNDAGFGVVSLYHTLIDSIDAHAFPESYALASRIMNLPVHQDIQPQQLTAMVDKLRQLV
jgi:dTDP-4-amino-4,6-dideoxygalactose transaminase